MYLKISKSREVILVFTGTISLSQGIAPRLGIWVRRLQGRVRVRPESLDVKACFVDEGPTLKRFRPRAKGSASRINKRTAHITVIVATREEA